MATAQLRAAFDATDDDDDDDEPPTLRAGFDTSQYARRLEEQTVVIPSSLLLALRRQAAWGETPTVSTEADSEARARRGSRIEVVELGPHDVALDDDPPVATQGRKVEDFDDEIDVCFEALSA